MDFNELPPALYWELCEGDWYRLSVLRDRPGYLGAGGSQSTIEIPLTGLIPRDNFLGRFITLGSEKLYFESEVLISRYQSSLRSRAASVLVSGRITAVFRRAVYRTRVVIADESGNLYLTFVPSVPFPVPGDPVTRYGCEVVSLGGDPDPLLYEISQSLASTVS